MSTSTSQRQIIVWDGIVRGVHWGITALVLINFINDSGSEWHRYMGYACVILVLIRLCWGLISRGYGHFSQWKPNAQNLKAYFHAILAGHPPRHLGLNPAGALMALLLWALLIALGISGWMMRLDAFWGEEWLQNVHAVFAYTLLTCIAIHVISVIAMSIRHKENLAKAMVTGKKRSL